MRVLGTSTVLGLLLLAGAMSQAVGQPVSSNPSSQSADEKSSSADRDAFLQKVRDEMDEWGKRLHSFGERARASSEKAGTAAGKDLNIAWADTQTEARRLQNATTAGWDSARAAYENASHGLAGAWDRIRPEDK